MRRAVKKLSLLLGIFRETREHLFLREPTKPRRLKSQTRQNSLFFQAFPHKKAERKWWYDVPYLTPAQFLARKSRGKNSLKNGTFFRNFSLHDILAAKPFLILDLNSHRQVWAWTANAHHYHRRRCRVINHFPREFRVGKYITKGFLPGSCKPERVLLLKVNPCSKISMLFERINE